ncbi:hypothetical protein KCP69_24870 [Salmonella enterica subsp. enterica]|nr:hypothetical protein KCP69_24870 [Salmonella enterica subsp. enterica]
MKGLYKVAPMAADRRDAVPAANHLFKHISPSPTPGNAEVPEGTQPPSIAEFLRLPPFAKPTFAGNTIIADAFVPLC